MDISHLAPPLQVFVLSCGLFFFFQCNAYLEEYTFKSLPGFSYGWYLTFWELLAFSGFAALERKGRSENVFQHSAPFSRHMVVAVAMTISRGLTNVSLQYLNYPTQVIFKSMKLITVMIGSVVMLGKSYPFLDYVAALILIASSILFSLGDIDTAPEFDMWGIGVVLLSLIGDALHSNSQESVLRTHRAGLHETMLFSNLFSAACVFVVCLLSGELFEAIAFCHERPFSYVLFVSRALVIYWGVLCFVTLIKGFGVVLATTITTVRKILSVLLSFVIFPKPFSFKHFIGLTAFIIGLALNIHVKKKEIMSKQKPAVPMDDLKKGEEA